MLRIQLAQCQFLRILRQPIACGLLVCCWLIQAPGAIAGYQPPANPSAPKGSTTTTGVRGACTNGLTFGITALAPHSHVGQTASTHPTFAWYVQDTQPYEMRFQLYRLAGMQQPRQQVYEMQMQTQPGIMQLTLPKDQAGLTIGERYEWQVVMICDPNRPSQSAVAKAELEVATLPAALKSAIAAANRDISQLYAEAGFWYDALAASLQSGSTTRQTTLALLQDLAELEAQTVQAIPDAEQSAARLQKIVATEQQRTTQPNRFRFAPPPPDQPPNRLPPPDR